MPPLEMLFRVVNGFEKIASQEICEKLNPGTVELSPYGSRGWIKCEVGDYSLEKVRRLRSVAEAYIVVYEEKYGERFSLDHFADKTVEAIPVYASGTKRISVSSYSVRGKPSQRRVQGAFSRRIVEKLNAESSFRKYDTALWITLLKRVAVAAINLEIRPGNIYGRILTHPTPLLPPIAYCMVRLCSPRERERLLDPMCGCGTIPLMAALEWGYIKITGADIKEEYVSCARKNAEVLGVQDRAEFVVSDISGLADRGVEEDIIAVNPPYGVVLPTQGDLDRLYETLFKEALMIMSSNGRMVTVTPYPEVVEREAAKQMLMVDSVHRILEGELPRAVHLITRKK